MPAKDFIHNTVKNALIKDGWTITNDPYTIRYEDDSVYADLGAERPFAAERAGQKIAALMLRKRANQLCSRGICNPALGRWIANPPRA